MLFAQQHASLHGKTCTKPAAATTATTTPTKQASQLAYLQHSHRAMVAPVHAPLNCLSPHSSSTMARSLGTPRAARSAAAASLASSTPSPQADDGVNVDEIMLSFGTVGTLLPLSLYTAVSIVWGFCLFASSEVASRTKHHTRFILLSAP